MSVTLSHQSALDAIRVLRYEGMDMHEMTAVQLTSPSAWVGRRLGMRNFAPDVWRWNAPSAKRPLHILVPNAHSRVRGTGILAHAANGSLPTGSILWLDENSSVVCPELLFLQMADSFSLPALVMLGMELCGHFSRQADDPLMGDVVDGVPAATSVERLKSHLAALKGTKGLRKAREALRYVCDHAVSAPEAVLAVMFGLPPEEGGYGMGPLLLNERVQLGESGSLGKAKNRYPDLMFGFAPVGLNYDGSKHFSVIDLMAAAEALARSDAKGQDAARGVLRDKLLAARAKVIDDNLRNRQLAAEGRIVFSVTKEDLSNVSRLDELARQVLNCASKVFGADVEEHLETLNNGFLARERGELLEILTPHAAFGVSSYGKL